MLHDASTTETVFRPVQPSWRDVDSPDHFDLLPVVVHERDCRQIEAHRRYLAEERVEHLVASQSRSCGGLPQLLEAHNHPGTSECWLDETRQLLESPDAVAGEWSRPRSANVQQPTGLPVSGSDRRRGGLEAEAGRFDARLQVVMGAELVTQFGASAFAVSSRFMEGIGFTLEDASFAKSLAAQRGLRHSERAVRR